jgi:membrane-associated phospholipid phosphatase
LKNTLLHKPFIAETLKNRVSLFFILLGIQSLFFVTNMLNSVLRSPTDGLELKFAVIDNHIVPNGVALIPYTVGFFLSALLPLWAAYRMPIKLYRQYIFAMAVAALFSYVIYIVFPTYVIKPAPEDVTGDGFLSSMLMSAYHMDNSYSTHNALPSQHVFYAIINMCFMIKFRPNRLSFWTWSMLAASITLSALLTRQHHSPDLVAGYLVAVGAYWGGSRLGAWVTKQLGDENCPIVVVTPNWMGGKKQREFDPKRTTKPI